MIVFSYINLFTSFDLSLDKYMNWDYDSSKGLDSNQFLASNYVTFLWYKRWIKTVNHKNCQNVTEIIIKL